MKKIIGSLIVASSLISAPLIAQTNGPGSNGPKRPSGDQIFAMMDKNKDGSISRAEFNAAHARMQQRRSEIREKRMERRSERRADGQ